MNNPTEFVGPQHGSHEAVDKTAISEAIYGMMTVLALIVVLEDNPPGPWRVVAIIGATYALAFAKAYANVVAEILSKRILARTNAPLAGTARGAGIASAVSDSVSSRSRTRCTRKENPRRKSCSTPPSSRCWTARRSSATSPSPPGSTSTRPTTRS